MDESISDEQKPEDRKAVILSIGKDIKKIVGETREFIADASRELSKAEDIGNMYVALADVGGDYSGFEMTIASGIEYWNSLKGLYGIRDKFYAIQPSISTSGSITVYSSSADISVAYPSMEPEQMEKAGAIRATITEFVDRERYQDRVREELARFNFEDVDIMVKFNGAWELFEQRPEGVDLTTGIAIALRETFNMVIGELLRRRPRQEKARGREIISIGSQLGKDSIAQAFFDRLQNQIDNYLNKLSGKKQKSETINEIKEFLLNGTILLESFLEALDPEKLRK